MADIDFDLDDLMPCRSSSARPLWDEIGKNRNASSASHWPYILKSSRQSNIVGRSPLHQLKVAWQEFFTAPWIVRNFTLVMRYAAGWPRTIEKRWNQRVENQVFDLTHTRAHMCIWYYCLLAVAAPGANKLFFRVPFLRSSRRCLFRGHMPNTLS